VIAFLIKAAVVYYLIVKPFQALLARLYPAKPGETAAAPPDVQLLTEIRDLLKARA
jgi:large conductance mechanosensitive channel